MRIVIIRKRRVVRRNKRDNKNKDFEERGCFGREKGQNLWNCRENCVLGVSEAKQTQTSKNKTKTTKQKQVLLTKQKQVLLEQPQQQQQLLEQQQQ